MKKIWRQAPWVCPWLSPLVVNLQSKIKGWRLRKWMNATPRNKKSSRKQKGRIPTNKLREQQPCQIPAYPSTSPRKERQSKPLFFQDSETTHHHKNQPLLLQERQAKGRNIKDKRDLSQGWQRTTTFQDQATIFKKVKQKEEEADSIISPTWPPTYLLEGSLPPLQLSKLLQKDRYKKSAIRQASAIPIYPA